MGSYLTVIFRSRSTETRLNRWTVLTGVTIFMLEFATLMVGFTTVLLGVNIWDIVDTSNTSPDSCVINVKPMLRRTNTRAVQAKLFCIYFKINDGSTKSIMFAMKYHEAYDAKKKKLGSQDTEEGLNRSNKLFGDERDELLVESQELLQRGEIELNRSQEFMK
ncbi:hypothetical protein IGI04_034964 [Brassica rapa subsp. trilocularis]|uniref:DUF4220 domain-containing protein n=1 Tax=Brassica rapa subsp. trilocularis TaxID=1813537 RepID=A0ABQ7LA92_BRACM|nr:hypothetical protein IGI04_034964 [Brassica rapa subsp. trilocularis]